MVEVERARAARAPHARRAAAALTTLRSPRTARLLSGALATPAA
jgi:hypothetical protein